MIFGKLTLEWFFCFLVSEFIHQLLFCSLRVCRSFFQAVFTIQECPRLYQTRTDLICSPEGEKTPEIWSQKQWAQMWNSCQTVVWSDFVSACCSVLVLSDRESMWTQSVRSHTVQVNRCVCCYSEHVNITYVQSENTSAGCSDTTAH